MSFYYVLETIIGSLTFIPFILLAVVSIRKWIRTRKAKEPEQQNDSFYFNAQLFFSCLIHSTSFILPPPPKVGTSENKEGDLGFKTPFTCFMQAYLNIVSIEITLLILNLILILSYLMISAPETFI